MTRLTPISRWIFEEFSVSAKSLAIYRIVFCLALLLIEFPRYQWMAKFPGSFWAPPHGPGVFFRQPPPAVVMWCLLAAVVTLTITLLVGYRTKLAGLALAACFVFGNTFDYGYGKINHDILLIVVLAVMSFSTWGKEFSFDASHSSASGESRSAWPVAMMAMLIAFAMLTAAVPKARTGWLSPHLNCTYGHVVFNYCMVARHSYAAEFALSHFPGWLWKSLDWLTLAVEGGFLAAMFSMRATRVFCALAVLFHAGIDLFMHITFWENALAYGVFVEWERCLRIRRVAHAVSLIGQLFGKVGFWFVLVSGLGATALYTRFRTIDDVYDAQIYDSLVLAIGVVVALCYLCGALNSPTAKAGTPHPKAASVDMGATKPLILFDGTCALCNGFLSFVLARDGEEIFRFAPLQSPSARHLLEHHGLPADYLDSILLAQGDVMKRDSASALEIMQRLGLPWSLLYILILIPPVIRDTAYKLVANNRYKWFGRSDSCRIPTERERQVLGQSE